MRDTPGRSIDGWEVLCAWKIILHSGSIGCGMSSAQHSVLHTKDFCYELPLLCVSSHPSSVFLLLLSPFSLLPNIAPNACPSYKDFAVSILYSKKNQATGKPK